MSSHLHRLREFGSDGVWCNRADSEHTYYRFIDDFTKSITGPESTYNTYSELKHFFYIYRVVCENISAYSTEELKGAAENWNQNKYLNCLNKLRKHHVPLQNVK